MSDVVTIRTKSWSHPVSGAGRVTAKAQGRQRTLPYDHALGWEKAHEQAARTLMDVIGVTGELVEVEVNSPRRRKWEVR